MEAYNQKLWESHPSDPSTKRFNVETYYKVSPNVSKLVYNPLARSDDSIKNNYSQFGKVKLIGRDSNGLHHVEVHHDNTDEE
jgi:hypothetical protein